MKNLLSTRSINYATAADFCRLFKDEMRGLYLLALALTADSEKAQQAFVSGLQDCSANNQVFKEWALSWARRAIIKNAIRTELRADTQVADQSAGENAPGEISVRAFESQRLDAQLQLPAEITALFALPAFERFAFVMSFCEGYSDLDCALLLGCTREKLITARVRALQLIGASTETRNRSLTQTILQSVRGRGISIDGNILPLATPA